MAIAFRGSVVGSVTNGGTVSLDLTGIVGLAQDDIVLAFTFSSAGTEAAPSGYTAIHNHSFGTNTGRAHLSYKIQTSSVDTSISFYDTGDNDQSGTGVAIAFSGVDTITPLDTTSIEVTTATDPGAIVPASDNCCIVIFGGQLAIDGSIGTVASYTQPTNHTTTSNDAVDTTCATAYRILSGGAGASEDPANWSTWAATANRVAYTVALRPGPEGQPFALREGSYYYQWNNPWRGGWELMRNILVPRRPRLIGA